jgi:hypothetical protein
MRSRTAWGRQQIRQVRRTRQNDPTRRPNRAWVLRPLHRVRQPSLLTLFSLACRRAASRWRLSSSLVSPGATAALWLARLRASEGHVIGITKRAAQPLPGATLFKASPAASYSPTRSPSQYHRR